MSESQRFTFILKNKLCKVKIILYLCSVIRIMIGIYKITSPTNRVYIGQSINIEIRFSKYKCLDCKAQPKLYKSILKYGYENHKFETLELCIESELNNKERYWQDFYNSADRGHLNCRYTASTDKTGSMSLESRQKMSISRTGLKRTNNLIERLKIINTGSKRSEESKLKMKIAQTGKKHSSETIKKRSDSMKKTLKEKFSSYPKKQSKKMKKIICIETNKIYDSLSQCVRENNLIYKTIWNQLIKGTNLKYKYI